MKKKVKMCAQATALAALGMVSSAMAAPVDLLVVYDDHSNQYFNGQVETAMRNWVAQVNGIYQNSQVDLQLRLVGVMPRNIAGNSMGEVLGNVRVDGTVAQRREQVGADFVTQLHKTGACGVGYMAVDKNWAFNVVGPNCGAQVLAHELGHNMGLNHSRKQGDQSGARYRYGLGYGVDGSFATTMAYPQVFNANWVPKFANPNLSCNGMPCGRPVGASDEAFDALALNNVKGELSNFMPTRVYGDRLNAGQELWAGQSIFSNNRQYELAMQTDGHLVLYGRGRALWASNTWRSDANHLVMQTDGNLVLYGPSGPKWASNTWRSPANVMMLQDDGNLVMYGPGGPVWATGTWR